MTGRDTSHATIRLYTNVPAMDEFYHHLWKSLRQHMLSGESHKQDLGMKHIELIKMQRPNNHFNLTPSINEPSLLRSSSDELRINLLSLAFIPKQDPMTTNFFKTH